MIVLTASPLALEDSLPLVRLRSRTVNVLGICLFILAGVLCASLAYLVMFTTFRPYDDEGWVMFTIRRMLDGKALYHDMKLPYGPAYYLTRWLAFGAGHVPLNNDTSRILALATWILCAALIGFMARIIGGWFVGAFALTAAIGALNRIANEPGHAQEVHILLLIIAFLSAAYWQKRSSPKSDRWFWFILGVSVFAMALTKINVGVFFGFAVIGAASVLLIRGKGSRVVFVLFCVGLLAMPWALVARRQGWADFAGLITLSLAPLSVSVATSPAGKGFNRRQLLGFFAGACVGTIVPVGFALLQGNNFADMYFAMVTRPRRDYAATNWGWPLAVSPAIMMWAAANAVVGVVVIHASRRELAPGGRARAALLAARLIGFVAFVILVNVFGDVVATIPLAWLAIAPTPTGPPATDRTRFFRSLVAFAACLMPLQVFPVPGSQIRMGTLPMTVAAVIVLGDLLADLGAWHRDRRRKSLVSPRRIGWTRVVTVIVWITALGPAFTIAGRLSALIATWDQRVPIDLPGCRLTRMDEPDAAIYRFLAENVGELSDGYLARTGLNSLHWWADVPVISSTPIGNAWSMLDADSDADLMSAYATRPRLMFIDHANYFSGQEAPDLRISRFIADRFRPLARAWDWTLLVRKDRLDSPGLSDIHDCATIVGQSDLNVAGAHAIQYVFKLAPAKGKSLREIAHAEIVDYDAGATLFEADIPPGGIGSLRLSIRVNGQDLEKAMKPAVRLLNRNGDVLQILPIVFAPRP